MTDADESKVPSFVAHEVVFLVMVIVVLDHE